MEVNEEKDSDDDEINMSELEELMEDLSMEEEIDDEISCSAIQGFTHK